MAVPKLRFKEFDGDWSNKKIGNIASKVGSGSTPRGGAEAYTDHGIIFIRSQNVNNDQLLLDDVAYIPEETHVKMSGSKVIANDILLNITGASIGRSCVVPHDFTEANVNQHVCIIRTPNDDPIFVQSFLSSENGQNAIQSKQAGGGREGLNFQAIRSIDFHFPPSKAEQTKIASFLSAVDEKISQLTQKHALLSQYKQGMMQKLFSQQIRFKADDGSEFGEWDEYSLDTLLSKIIDNRGKTPVTEANLEIPLIEVNAIGQRRIKYEKVSKYFSEDTFQNWFRAYLEHQDILFSTVGNTAICSIYTDEIKAGIAQNIVGLRANTKLIQPTFLYYLLTEISNNQKFKSIEMQAVQPSIKVSQMIHLTFLTPCLEEQTKIANFLSSIDQKIEVTAQQIEQAKQWKKGLLQQMFV